MNPNFASCLKRIDGARQDFESLGKQLAALQEAHGEPVRLRGERQDNRQRIVYYVESVMPIPDDWDRRIAHILYDVRSGLDHLVHELYVATNAKRPPPRIAARLQFPICTTARAWANELRKHRVEGIGASFVEIIRKHQPYRIKRPTRHALERLRRFSDQDKHRRPNVVLIASRNFHIEVTVRGIGTPSVDPVGVKRALKVGAEFAHIYVAPWGPMNQNVNVKAHGTFSPSLERGTIVDDLLSKVLSEGYALIEQTQGEWAAAKGKPALLFRPAANHDGSPAVKGIVP